MKEEELEVYCKRSAELAAQLAPLAAKKHPFKELLEAQDYHAIIKSLESRMTKDSELIQDKFWWVIAQLKIGTIPVSALTASLEPYVGGSDKSQDYSLLASWVYLELSVVLLKRGQFRVALTTVRHAFSNIRNCPSADSGLAKKIRDTLKEMLERELIESRIRKDAREYQIGLHDEMKRVAAWKPSKTGVATKSSEAQNEPKASSSKGIKNPILSAKTILQEASALQATISTTRNLGEDVSARKQDTSENATESIAQEHEQEGNGDESIEIQKIAIIPDAMFSEETAKKSVKNKIEREHSMEAMRRRYVWAGSAFVVLGIFFLSRTFLLPQDSLHEAIEPCISPFSHDLLAPDLPFVLALAAEGKPGVGISSLADRLDALEGRSQRTNEAQKGESNPRNAPDVDQSALALAGETKIENDEIAKPDNKEEVHSPINDVTKDPEVEPNRESDLAGLDGPLKKKPEDRYKDKLPRLDVEEIARANIQTLDNMGPHVSYKGMGVGDDGRIYGPGPGVYGANVPSFPVRQFSPPKGVKVIKTTAVLTAPSMVGVKLSDAQSGERLEATAHIGLWLEVLVDGKKGYILAQDVDAK